MRFARRRRRSCCTPAKRRSAACGAAAYWCWTSRPHGRRRRWWRSTWSSSAAGDCDARRRGPGGAVTINWTQLSRVPAYATPPRPRGVGDGVRFCDPHDLRLSHRTRRLCPRDRRSPAGAHPGHRHLRDRPRLADRGGGGLPADRQRQFRLVERRPADRHRGCQRARRGDQVRQDRDSRGGCELRQAGHRGSDHPTRVRPPRNRQHSPANSEVRRDGHDLRGRRRLPVPGDLGSGSPDSLFLLEHARCRRLRAQLVLGAAACAQRLDVLHRQWRIRVLQGHRSSDTTYFLGRNAWTFGPQSHSCHGAAFGPKEAPAESTVVAFHNFADTALDAIAVYTREGRYALTVVEGYALSDKRIQRDAHEEDNFCDAADAKPILLGNLPNGTYLDTLAIENAHDVDWFRFNVPGSGAQPVRFRTAPRPLAAVDSSDIDLYVLNVPASGDTVMTGVAIARAGSTVDTTLTLAAPADYYAVVVDFAGIPTRYSLCIGFASTLLSPKCTALPAAAPVPLSAAQPQASVMRRTRLEAAIERRGPRLAPLRSAARWR